MTDAQDFGWDVAVEIAKFGDEDQACLRKVLHEKKAKGMKIDSQAIAIAMNECSSKNAENEDPTIPADIKKTLNGKEVKDTLFKESSLELPYVIHKHTVGDKIDYQLSIQSKSDELWFAIFPQTGKETLVNSPNITRLFGRESEDTRSEKWLTYEGETRNSEGMMEIGGQMKPISGIYEILDKGTVKIGIQDNNYSEVFFQGNILTDRWILRKIPNVFDKSLLGDVDTALLLWKPPMQKSYNAAFDKDVAYNTVACNCPVADASAKFAEITGAEEGVEMTSKFFGGIEIDEKTQEFHGIASAVGTVVDYYGVKYTYTPEFVTFLYNEQKSMLEQGIDTPLNTDHDQFGTSIDGKVTGVQLVQEPLKHLAVNGIYNGPLTLSEGEIGLSYELRLKSVWSEDFQSWVPFQAKIDKLSVVRRPACKICWVNKVI